MNRDKIGTQICYVHQHTFVGTLMYVACLCPSLVSVHFFKSFSCLLSIVSNNSH